MRLLLVLLLTSLATAAHAEPAKCSHADALGLAKILGARWKSAASKESGRAAEDKTDGEAYLDGPNSAWLSVHCAAGSFGKRAFFIEAVDNHFVGTNRIMVRRRLIVTRDGGVLASAPDEKELSRLEDHSFTYRTLDLDGDGVDEVLIGDSFSHHALAQSESIAVFGIRKAKLVALGTMTIETGGRSWPTCEGKQSEEKVGKATRLVVTVATTQPECRKAGKHYYGVVGDKLVEIHRDGKPMLDAKP